MKRINEFVAIAMILLIVMLPAAIAQETQPPVGGELPLNVELPRFVRSERIDVTGTTAENARVEVIVNGQLQRAATVADGSFDFSDVILTPNADNAVVVKALLDSRTAQKQFTVGVDVQPPAINLTLPPAARQTPLELSGNASEQVTLKMLVSGKANDTTAPDRITGLRASEVTANSALLQWNATTATDILEYAVYRDGTRIAVTRDSSFSDSINTDTLHEYEVSAVDTGCNEGLKSDALTVRSSAGGQQVAEQNTPVALGCEVQAAVQEINAGSFKLQLPLQEGINNVNLTFEDKAGNSQKFFQEVLLDTLAPQFLEHNLDRLSPSFVPTVTVKGRLSEKASIQVFLNGEDKPTTVKVTNDDGTFSIDVQLRRDFKLNTSRSSQRFIAELEEGFRNQVKLVAVDLSGNRAELGPFEIVYALCGSGTFWDVRLEKPIPATLTPRLLLEQVQQVTIPFNMTYRGGFNFTELRPRDVVLNFIGAGSRFGGLSPEIAKDFDNDKIELLQVQFERSTLDRNTYNGVMQIAFNHVPEPFEGGRKNTTFHKEKNLSEHRLGDCLVPGFGCMKMFLEFDVNFQELLPPRPLDPRVLQQQGIVPGRPEPVNRRQRSCINMEFAIDKPIPRDVIPKGFLKQSVKILDSLIDGIQTVLKPLQTIGTYTLYACGVANIILFFTSAFKERYACDFVRYSDLITPDKRFKREVAEAGLCEAYKPADTANDAAAQERFDKCMSCQNAIQFRKDFEYKWYNPICDRVFCPSAPTLQSHVRNFARERLTQLPADVVDIYATQQGYTKITVNKKDGYYVGSDCSAYAQTLLKEQIERGKRGRLALGYAATQDIYSNYITNKDDNKCRKLHPATPECCGVEYQQEWGSACGISAFGLDTFDEIKESTCLAAQKAGKNEITAENDNTKVQCNKLFNAVAGFCEKTGQPLPEVIYVTGLPAANPLKPDESSFVSTYHPYNNELYIFAVPQAAEEATLGLRLTEGSRTLQQQPYIIFLGYASETLQLEKVEELAGGNIKVKRPAAGSDLPSYYLNSQLSAVELEDLHDVFYSPVTPQEATEAKISAETPVSVVDYVATTGKVPQSAVTELTKKIGQIPELTTDEKARLTKIDPNKLIKAVASAIGETDQEYIVKPDSGFLRSIQCACIPAVTGYLQLWKNIFTHVRNCFQSIVLTGDGTSGICQAALSNTICDMLFEAVKCFAQKYNIGLPRGGVGASSGIGDFVGAMTAAGSDVSRKVRSRYGDTGVFKTLFIDRKLVNAVCNFAFTGTWSLDVNGLFQQAIQDIPIDSQGKLFPCERKFVSFNPLTRPKGLATWNYHFGVFLAAGADLSYNMRLKCSKGFRCSDKDDFKNGECDCNKRDEETLPVVRLPGNSLRKGDILSEEVFEVVAESPVRFDTAILEWSYKDNRGSFVTQNESCYISQGGEGPPGFCSFDPFALAFRCSFGESGSSIGIKSATATPPKKDGTARIDKVFALGEPLTFELQIKQSMPEDKRRDFEHQKFLSYKIIGENGETVLGIEPGEVNEYTLSVDGERTVEVPVDLDTTLKGYVVNTGDITKFKTGGIAAVPQRTFVRVSQQGAVFGEQNLAKPLVKSVQVFEGNVQVQKNIVFMWSSQNPDIIKVALALQQPAVDPQKGLENTKLPNTGFTDVSINADGTGTANLVESPVQLTGQQKTFGVNFIIERPLINGDVHAFVTSIPPKPSADPCKAASNTDMVSNWRAEFTIFNADRFGSPTQTVATDASGNEAKASVPFKVVCAKPEQLQAVIPPPPSALPAAQRIQFIIPRQAADEMRKVCTFNGLPIIKVEKNSATNWFKVEKDSELTPTNQPDNNFNEQSDCIDLKPEHTTIVKVKEKWQPFEPQVPPAIAPQATANFHANQFLKRTKDSVTEFYFIKEVDAVNGFYRVQRANEEGEKLNEQDSFKITVVDAQNSGFEIFTPNNGGG